MDVRFRPLPLWAHPETADRRPRSTFKASWDNTLNLLDRELRLLEATDIIIGCFLLARDIRVDGWPRANYSQPSHPGVEISFDSARSPRGRRLVYQTDTCEFWQHNVRSIAYGLEALRSVDRFGVSRRGEQYAGFGELAAGPSDGDPVRGAELIARAGSVRAALRIAHPDHGGNDRDFRDVQAARS